MEILILLIHFVHSNFYFLFTEFQEFQQFQKNSNLFNSETSWIQKLIFQTKVMSEGRLKIQICMQIS